MIYLITGENKEIIKFFVTKIKHKYKASMDKVANKIIGIN